ncbi:serine/threonine protein kinase [Thermoleptolyngbya sp.]
MSGQILGDRYEVEQQLGKQSGRWTLLARDLMTQELVILKVVFIDENLGPDDLKRFKREADALQVLAHPATPRYLGYFEIDLPRGGKALALIQTYLPGTSLAQYLKAKRTLSEAEAKQVARKALEILQYLHALQPPIVHRDIKSSNLLLSDDEGAIATQVSLIDFGSVKSLTPAEGTTFSIVGTEGYIAPEQIGRRAMTASDLYSLGVTLVTGMTGLEPLHLPHRGLRIDLDQCLQCSPEFSTWLKQMTEPDVTKRFRTADAALATLPLG